MVFFLTKCLRNAFQAVIFIAITKFRLLILARKIHILGEKRFPRVFQLDPCFPHPVFSTHRVFHTPGPRTPYPVPRNHSPSFSTEPSLPDDVHLVCIPNNEHSITRLSIIYNERNNSVFSLAIELLWMQLSHQRSDNHRV